MLRRQRRRRPQGSRHSGGDAFGGGVVVPEGGGDGPAAGACVPLPSHCGCSPDCMLRLAQCRWLLYEVMGLVPLLQLQGIGQESITKMPFLFRGVAQLPLVTLHSTCVLSSHCSSHGNKGLWQAQRHAVAMEYVIGTHVRGRVGPCRGLGAGCSIHVEASVGSMRNCCATRALCRFAHPA